MKKILLVTSIALLSFAGGGASFAQTVRDGATVGTSPRANGMATGTEAGNNASSLRGDNSATGLSRNPDAANSVDGRTSGSGSGSGASGTGAGAGSGAGGSGAGGR